jgi:hypothetical protein
VKFPAPALLAALTGSVFLLTAVPSTALGSEQAPPAADPPAAGTSPTSLTLVTGDRVTVGPPDQTGIRKVWLDHPVTATALSSSERSR